MPFKPSSTIDDYPEACQPRTNGDWIAEHQAETLRASIGDDLYRAMTNEMEDGYIHPCKVQFSPTEIALRETWRKSGTTLTFTTWLEKEAIPAMKELAERRHINGNKNYEMHMRPSISGQNLREG